MRLRYYICITGCLFLGCSHPRTSEEWALSIDKNADERPVAGHTYFSGIDSLEGLELEFVRDAQGLKAYINVAGSNIPGSVFAQVTVDAGPLHHSFLAKILPGRKRLELPQEALPHIANALESGTPIDVSIAFTPYKTRVVSKSFAQNILEINNLEITI